MMKISKLNTFYDVPVMLQTPSRSRTELLLDCPLDQTSAINNKLSTYTLLQLVWSRRFKSFPNGKQLVGKGKPAEQQTQTGL